MANLGSIGASYGMRARYNIPLDTAWARPFARPLCIGRSGADSHLRPRYPDQWRELRGSVLDSSGTGIARRVLAIDPRTGAVRGSTVSTSGGAFTLRLEGTIEPVTVISIPAAGDQRDAVIHFGVLPVVPT